MPKAEVMADGFVLPSPPAAALTSDRGEQEGGATSVGLRRPGATAKPTGFEDAANWPPGVGLVPHRSPLWQSETVSTDEPALSIASASSGSPHWIRQNSTARQSKSVETGGAAAMLSVGPKSAGVLIGRRQSDIDLPSERLKPGAGGSASLSSGQRTAGSPIKRRQSDFGFPSPSQDSVRWATLKEQYEHTVHRRRPGRHWPDGNDPARDWRVDVAFMQGCLTHGQYEYGWDVFESVSPRWTTRTGDQELLHDLPRTAVVLCLRAFSFCSPVQRWLWEARAWAVYNDVKRLTGKALDEARAFVAEFGEHKWKALLAHYERQGGRPLRDLLGAAGTSSSPIEDQEPTQPHWSSPASSDQPPFDPPTLEKLTVILNQAVLAMESQAFIIHKLFLMGAHADASSAHGAAADGDGQSLAPSGVPSIDVLRSHLNELLAPEFNRACFAVGGRRCEKCKAEIRRFVDHVSSTGERAPPSAQERPALQPLPTSVDALTPPPRASFSSPSLRSPFLRSPADSLDGLGHR